MVSSLPTSKNEAYKILKVTIENQDNIWTTVESFFYESPISKKQTKLIFGTLQIFWSSP
jgi:hypothetical protein